MVKILSFKTPYHREMGLLAKLWESLNYLDRFTKTFLVIFIGIIVTMPIITTQLFDLRQRAEQEDISQSTPNDILIKYKTGALEKNKKQLRNKYEITVSEEIKELNAERNHIKSLNKKSQIIEEIKQEKIVEYVEPNYIGKVQITKQENQINQNEDYFGPEINIANPVPLAILDTGTNYLLKTVKGYNFVNNNDNVTDSNGTGTFFTKAITSVNKEIPIIPIKVGDTTDKIYFWNLARGVVFAANQGAKIILITAGADNDSQILQEAINYAYGKNAIIVSAAGDLGYRGISSPAKLNNALAVGSLLTSGGRPEWSAVGPELDFVTKGVNINGHSGTSVSAAYASAILASVFAQDVNLSNLDVEEALTTSAIDLNTSGWDQAYGWGRIDAEKTLLMAKKLTVEKDILPPVVSINEPLNESLISEITDIYISAWDNTNVSRIDFLLDNQPFASDFAFPYIATLNPLEIAEGNHTLSAIAYDIFENKSSTYSIAIETIK